MGNVTLRHVAAVARVAVSTAAAALRGDACVKPATAARVRSAADKLGYRRDPVAALLGSRRSRNGRTVSLSVALVTGLEDGAGTAFAPALQRAAADRGWLWQVVNVRTAEEARTAGRRLAAAGIDGVIIGPTHPSDRELPLPWDEFAVVSLIRDRMSAGFDSVRVGHFSGARRLLAALRAAGHRRIGILHREHAPALDEDDARLGAWLLAAERAPEDIDLVHLPFHLPAAATEARLTRWLARRQRDAVIGFNAGDARLLEQLGCRLPEELSFVALNVHPHDAPRIAGLAAPPEFVAPMCLQRLEQQLRLGLRGPQAAPLEVVVTPPFVPGESLAARR